MRSALRVLILTIPAGILAGCGGGEVTPASLPAEQKAPDYGEKSQAEMNKMFPKMVKDVPKK